MAIHKSKENQKKNQIKIEKKSKGISGRGAPEAAFGGARQNHRKKSKKNQIKIEKNQIKIEKKSNKNRKKQIKLFPIFHRFYFDFFRF